MRWVSVSLRFCSWRNWRLEKLSKCPKFHVYRVVTFRCSVCKRLLLLNSIPRELDQSSASCIPKVEAFCKKQEAGIFQHWPLSSPWEPTLKDVCWKHLYCRRASDTKKVSSFEAQKKRFMKKTLLKLSTFYCLRSKTYSMLQCNLLYYKWVPAVIYFLALVMFLPGVFIFDHCSLNGLN